MTTHEYLTWLLKWLEPYKLHEKNKKNNNNSKRRRLIYCMYLADKKGFDIAKPFLERDCRR